MNSQIYSKIKPKSIKGVLQLKSQNRFVLNSAFLFQSVVRKAVSASTHLSNAADLANRYNTSNTSQAQLSLNIVVSYCR